jgi:VWFA-related protein
LTAAISVQSENIAGLKGRMNRVFTLLLVGLLALAGVALAQQKDTPTPQAEDVIRIRTDLVQTDVAVFDREGRFIENLKPSAFELRVNGKTREIILFDHISAGRVDEELQLAAARGRSTGVTSAESVPPSDRGRSFFFYVDDYHVSAGSLKRVRDLLLHFVERDLGQNDELAIITASGQLGILQQLTSDKLVLRTAIEKLRLRNVDVADRARTPMTEADAMAITRGDRRVVDYFVEQLQREMLMPRPRGPSAVASKARNQAETAVRSRAQAIVDQAAATTSATLAGLERLTRSSAAVAWRKVIFFVSDGFFLDGQVNSEKDLQRISDAAARTGTVIYSIEARGLVSGSPDASTRIAFDNTGRLAGNESGSVEATQQPLRSLALETGGRAFLNANDLRQGTADAIRETSGYYLIAWRPEPEEIQGGGFQTIEVTLKDSPNAIVRVRRGYIAQAAERPTTDAKAKSSQREKNQQPRLADSLHSLFRKTDLPVSLSVGYLDTPEELMSLTATVEVDSSSGGFKNSVIGNEPLELEVVGIVIDERGKAVGAFEQSLTVTGEALSSNEPRIIYNHPLQLASGLYQVRVAVQEKRRGMIGSAMQWIDVPRFDKGAFLLSSLFVGEMNDEARLTGKLPINANHRFRAGSRLGFLIYIYNAEHGASGNDVALQIQILRDDQPVVTKPLIKVNGVNTSGSGGVPYGEDIALTGLPAGRYVLKITAIDRIGKKSAEQQAKFTIH